MLQNQGINKVFLYGHVCGQPQWIAEKQEKYLSFNLLTQESINRNRSIDEHSEFHFIKMPESVAASITEPPEEGMQLYVEGKLNTLSNIDDDGIKRFDTGIIVYKYHVMAKAPVSTSGL